MCIFYLTNGYLCERSHIKYFWRVEVWKKGNDVRRSEITSGKLL